MRRKRNFVVRTIRGGAVRIYGVTFRPDEHHYAYDGRLDGQRWLFGLYWGPPNYSGYGPDGLNREFVAMWGSEERAKARTEQEIAACRPELNVIDGYIRWEWWRRVSETAHGEAGTPDAVDPTDRHTEVSSTRA